MKVTFGSRENDIVSFTIEFDAEEFESAQIEVYKKNKERYSVDGFRKGKAPRKVIEQRFGEGVFWEDAVEGLLQSGYTEALGEIGIEPINHPDVEIDELKKGAGFQVTMKVAVAPEVDVKDYTGVKIKAVKYDVTDEDVAKELETAQKRSTRHVEVERPAQLGDTLTIDFAGSIDGKAFEGGTAEGHSLKLGSGSFIAGFEDQLIGTEKGADVEVHVTFPEDYPEATLQGKAALFKVKVKEIREEDRPELSDAFAQDISVFETLEELKADMRKKLEEQAEMRADVEQKNAVLDAVYEANPIELPDVMIEDEINVMLNEFTQGLQAQGMDINMYLEYLQKSEADVRETFREDAKKRVGLRLITQSVAKAEGFTVTEEEIEAEVAQMAAQYGFEVDKFREYFGKSQEKGLEDDLIHRKAINYMMEMAIIEA
jgi:trigger factor